MKYLWIFLIAAFICLVTFIFMRNDNNQSTTSEVNPVELANEPTRIVSLAPNLTEILFALGLGERVAAVSSDSDYPPQAANKDKVGTFWSPNIEAIIKSKPDLVIALSTRTEHQKAVVDSLKRLQFEVLTLKLEKIEELLAAIKKIGVATGCEKRADELAADFNKKLNNLQQELSSAARVKVMWVVQVEPLRVAGRNTFINELIELAGGENAIGPTIAQYPSISSEELLASGIEVIIQSAMGTDNIPGQQRAAEAFWSKSPALPAVQNDRIYVIEPDITLRLGPRLLQGAETIAKCLHPDIFRQKDDFAEQSR